MQGALQYTMHLSAPRAVAAREPTRGVDVAAALRAAPRRLAGPGAAPWRFETIVMVKPDRPENRMEP